MAFIFTKHVGGPFDAAGINKGSYFYMEYEGAEGDIYLALESHSGAKDWTKIKPSSTTSLGNGRYASTFTYDDFSAAYGTNFLRLDQVSAYPSEKVKTTLKRFGYVAGTGEPVDNTEASWIRQHKGIAFIGDSIVHNVKKNILAFDFANIIHILRYVKTINIFAVRGFIDSLKKGRYYYRPFFSFICPIYPKAYLFHPQIFLGLCLFLHGCVRLPEADVLLRQAIFQRRRRSFEQNHFSLLF